MRITVEGGSPLNGIYRPSGNANAAQAMIAAALLAEGESTLHHMPQAASVMLMLQHVAVLGASVTWSGDEKVTINPAPLARRVLTQPEADGTLGMMLLVAPLLVSRQHVRVEADFPFSRFRTHLYALRDLGIGVTTHDSAIEFDAVKWEQKDITLLQTSVTATALILMVAARLGRETIIRNAACEPHVRTLVHMLNAMGARIEGSGSNVLHVWGNTLHGVEVPVPPDHIEAASIAAMAAITHGRVQIQGVDSDDLRLIAKVYQGLGIGIDLDAEAVFVPRHEALILSAREEDQDAVIETAPWPGFPSDLVAIATVVATQARGTCLIHEKLYNNRLLFVDKLKAMGAQIVLCDPHRAIVIGATPLHGIYMDSPDVRTGLGMLAAALAAEGTSRIDNAQSLEHSFAGALGKLQALNARITFE